MTPVPVELMQALVTEIGAPEPVPVVSQQHGSSVVRSPGGGGDACWNYIDKIERSVSAQRGHNRLWRAARACVVTFGLSDGEAADLLRRWNSGCQPEWSDKEIHHKIDQARANAREAPQRKDFRQSSSPKANGTQATKPAAPATATVTCLADVEKKPVEWLWSRRIPRGCITLLDGDPGLGRVDNQPGQPNNLVAPLCG